MMTTSIPRIKAVILDYGEVLCLCPKQEQLLRMANLFRISADEFATLYEKNRRAYDRGDLTPERYWFAFADQPGISLSANQIPRLRAWDVEMWSDLNPAMVKWLESVHLAGFKTALLSNMHVDMVAKVRGEIDWIKHIDVAVFSHEVKLAKPDATIYEYCLAGLETLPQETLFIDDREVNVMAADALGIRAVHFESVVQLRSQLQKIGFPIVPKQPAQEEAGRDLASRTTM
jgi:putative hydrolase of the HAD superfamily